MHEVDGQLAPGDEAGRGSRLWRPAEPSPSARRADGVRTDVSEVQIRREAAGAVDLRLAVVLGIVRQLALHELVEQTQRFAGAAAKGIDRLHGAIEVLPAFGDVEGAVVGQRLQAARLLPFDFRFGIAGAVARNCSQALLQSRSDDARGVLLFLQQLRGNDDVGIDGPERHAELLRGQLAPVVGLAQRILVADHERRLHLVAELQQRMLGIAAQHESDAALAGALGDVGNALREKCVVPQVGVRVKRHRREEDDDRLAEARWRLRRRHRARDCRARAGRAASSRRRSGRWACQGGGR